MSGNVVRTRSLRSNFSATALGNIAYTLCQFGILAGLARLAGSTEVGEYALALAITAPVFLLLGFRLRQIQATDAAGDYAPAEYFGLRLLSSGLAVLVCGVIGLLSQLPAAVLGLLVVLAVNKAIEGQIDVSYGVLHRRELMSGIARAQAFRGIVGLLLFVAILWATGSVTLAAVGLAGTSLLFVALALRMLRTLGVAPRPRFAVRRLLPLGRLALPLGVAAAIGSLAVNAPRYLLQAEAGAAQLGVFAVLAYAMFSTGIVIGSLAEVASPRLANYYAAADIDRFRSTVRRLMMLAVALGVAGVVAAAALGRPVLNVVFGPAYAREVDVLVVIMVAGAVQFAYLFLGTAVSAVRLFAVQAPINLIGLLAVVTAGLVLIPSHGLMGAALSVLAGQVARAAMYSGIYFGRVESLLSARKGLL